MRVVWPTRGDPRLTLSVIITTLQVLGQVVLDFKVSIAQILVPFASALASEDERDSQGAEVIRSDLIPSRVDGEGPRNGTKRYRESSRAIRSWRQM